MKIYRIEHKTSGDGMWAHVHKKKTIVELLTSDRLLNIPMPFSPRFKLHGNIWRTGVGDINNLYDWFTIQDMKEMLDMDMRLKEIDATDFMVEPMQVLFNERAITDKKDITSYLYEMLTP